MATPRSVTGLHRCDVTGWEWASTPAGDPEPAAPRWQPCPPDVAATTVAAQRRDAGCWSPDRPGDIDAEDHWFAATIGPIGAAAATSAPNSATTTRTLHFGGLATIADVWLDGELILQSTSMFATHDVDVTGRLHDGSRLLVRCSSLTAWLSSTRRPRPRWKTRLVENQNLRWLRTALFGRLASWGPAAPAVGPWRPVSVEQRATIDVLHSDVRVTCSEDGIGTVIAELAARALPEGTTIDGATLSVGSHTAVLDVASTPVGTVTIIGALTIIGVDRWWPHTHGNPTLHQVGITVQLRAMDGTVSDAVVDFGHCGFRTITVDRGHDGEGFTLIVNGVPVFCRGAVWMPPDPIALSAPETDIRGRLRLLAAGGMNMLRLSGVTVYEADGFHRACDELGIMVWQDLMLANLDVAVDDPVISAQIDAEIDGLMDRLQLSPSLTVVCGSSELDQQATMVGIDPEMLAGSTLHTDLAARVARQRPDVTVVASSPTGGHLPFSVDAGVGHYYGVGAYLRPLTDARHAGVRFASECLAFANVPDPAGVRRLMGSGPSGPTEPRWKARIPRDAGTGWDFEDVTNHYMAALFGVDPVAVRYADVDRYLALGRATSAEVMSRTISEWRRPTSPCAGALVWYLNDALDGAGWGLIDGGGHPKAAFYGATRAMRSVALVMSDEGVNGLDSWAHNDGPLPISGVLELTLFRAGRTVVASASTPLEVPAHSSVRIRTDAAIGRFTDPTYAYRFGPPAHDSVVGTWRRHDGSVVDSAFHFPLGPGSERHELGLRATAERTGADCFSVTISTGHLARYVTLDVGPAFAADDHFHLAPDSSRTIAVTSAAATATRGYVSALNSTTEVAFSVDASRS